MSSTEEGRVQLDDFNAMAPEAAAAAVRPCVDIDSWVDAVVDGRPYAGLDALLEHADRQAEDWTPAEVERALAGQAVNDHAITAARLREIAVLRLEELFA